MLVVDSSLLVAVLFEEEHSGFAAEALASAGDTPLLAPGLLRWEITNVLRTKVVRTLISESDAERRLRSFAALGIAEPDTEISPAGLLLFALESGLSAYDAAYVELARREGASLATLDAAMARAARDHGVVVMSPFA
jgi:predicted nucleic acid-binding protein